MKLKATYDGKTRSFTLRTIADNRCVGWIDEPSKNGTEHCTFKLSGYHIGTGATVRQCLEWANNIYELDHPIKEKKK